MKNRCNWSTLVFAVVLLCTCVYNALAQTSIVDVTDSELDLSTQVQAHKAEVTALVETGPQLVVGQGQDANNKTLIRCLDEYGVTRLQFLAYPVSITGGVNVNTGDLTSDTGLEIVASPITSTTTRNIRVFTNTGLLKSEFDPGAAISTPFLVAVGDFLPSHSGDEIAVTARYPSGQVTVKFYDGYGTVLASYNAPVSNPVSGEDVKLATLHIPGGNLLLIGYPKGGLVYSMLASSGACQVFGNSSIGDFNYLSESVVNGEIYAVGKTVASNSTLWSRSVSSAKTIEAGRREKEFSIAQPGNFPTWSDSDYVKNASFRHLRTDYACPIFQNPDFNNNNYDYWTGGSFLGYIDSSQADYFSAVRSVWEPCFTHRVQAPIPSAWNNSTYMMLSRLNNFGVYTEGTTNYDEMTYATNLPALDHLHAWPLRAFLLKLADKFRGVGGAPERTVAVEPNHELEVYVPQDSSIGDYNPNMILGFYNDLLRRYNSLTHINSKFGTSFTPATFDAPRNNSRGSWDGYSTGNAFYKAWVEYNRKIINSNLALGMREALLAGFPPAVIKTHQIPADYAVGPVISGHRITPIDWILAGSTGYGATKYGLWYPNGDFVQNAFTSGFNMTGVGEYSPLTSDQNGANAQMDYMWNNGINFVNAMNGGNETVTQNSYLRLRNYGPRPGTAEGIGQIRAVTQTRPSGANKHYNIVCMGNTGLLKSVNADGTWEGTVYAEPFRQRMTVTAVQEGSSFNLTTSDYAVGPINGLRAGDQIDINFKARSSNANPMYTLLLLHDGVEMPGHRHSVGISSTDQYYRYTLRVQEPMDSIYILLNSGERDGATGYQQTIVMSDFSVYTEKPSVGRVEYGINTGTTNTGGVTFDVLSSANVPQDTMARAETWAAAADFSRIANPAGPWQYGSFSQNGNNVTFGPSFAAFTHDWITSDWDNVPGWFMNGQNQWPGVALSNGTFYLGSDAAPSGHMVCYIPSAVKWTAPKAATVSIQGCAWNLRSATTLGVVINGQLQFSVSMSGRTFGAPYTFAQAITDYGGSPAQLQNISVVPGDTIMLLNGPGGDYMGFDFSVVETATSGTVGGTVTDQSTGAPVSGATVALAGTAISATTSATGGYKLSAVPQGSYTMSVTGTGYYVKNTRLDVPSHVTATVDVQLTSAPAASYAWDVAAGYSDTNNPTTAWEFGVGGSEAFWTPYDSHTTAWIPSDWTNCPGWFIAGDPNNHHWNPGGICKSNGTFSPVSGAAPAGRLTGYGNIAVEWTSPRATTISIYGDAYNVRTNSALQLVVAGNSLFTIPYLSGRPHSNPFAFVEGVGGDASLLQDIPVNAGDKVLLLLGSAVTGYQAADYVGFDLTITESGATLFWDNFDAGKRVEWRDDAGTSHNSTLLGTLVTDDNLNEAVVSSLRVKDASVAVDFNAATQGGLLARYTDTNNFVLAFFSRAQNTMAFHEKVNGNWGSWLAPVGISNVTGTKVRLTLQTAGNVATVTAIDEYNNTAGTSTTLSTLLSNGLTGIYHDNGTGLGTQYFDNFIVY